LLALLRRRIGGLDTTRTARSASRILAASAVAAAAAFAAWYVLDLALGRGLGGQLVSLTAGIAAATAAYLVSCRLLGVRELQSLLSLRARTPRA
jgi:hypothetical protein